MILSKYCLTLPIDASKTLLVNSLSGAVDVIANEELTLVQRHSPTRALIDLAATERYLRARHHLVADSDEEERRLENLYARYRRLESNRPRRFGICPTYFCNLACPYCFEGTLTGRKELMTEDQLACAFEAIKRLCEQQPPERTLIELFGGEPLQPQTQQIVSTTLQRCAAERYSVAAITNGFYMTEFVPMLRQWRNTLRFAQITLDGPPAVHDARRYTRSQKGTFERIARGIDMMLAAELTVRMRVNLDRQNIETIMELFTLFEQRGWRGSPYFHIHLAPLTDHFCTGKLANVMAEDDLYIRLSELEDLGLRLNDAKVNVLRILRRVVGAIDDERREQALPAFRFCEANRGELFMFGPDGYIYPCTEAIGRPETRTGRFSPELALDQQRTRSWQDRSIMCIPQCRDCPVALFCGGGCAYAAEVKYGRLDRPVCPNGVGIVQRYVEYMRPRLAQQPVTVPHGKEH